MVHRAPGAIAIAAGLLAVMVFAAPAFAIPALQLYIEGSTYDPTDESWLFTGDDFKLWVIGDVESYGTIFDVKLTMTFPAGLTGWSVEVIPTTATSGLLPSPGDPSAPPGGSPLAPVPMPVSSPDSNGPCTPSATTASRIPCKGNGAVLASHGEYGSGVEWVEFDLGDLSLTDSPIGDYIHTPPTTFPSLGQINAYEIHVRGFPASTMLHFDAFDHIVLNGRKAKTVFAPFSHDVLDAPAVPEPSTVLLLGGAMLVIAALPVIRGGRRRRS
jgi:hypothetical protein